MMSRPYTRSVLEINVAQICQTIGWHGISSTSLELLTDLLHRYLVEMSKTTHTYAELFHRTQPNLNDIGLAFKAMNVNITDLEEYVQYVDSVPSAVPAPDYPVKKDSHLNFLKPGSQEVVIRPVHIHEYLPPIHPIIEEEQNKNNPKGQDQAINNCGLLELPSNSQGTDGVFKRPGEPPSSFETPNKRLRLRYEEECGSRPTREISSVMMTTSGFISPAREGKLPEAKTPITPVEAPINPPTLFPSISEFNKVEKKAKKLQSEEKKMDKEKKRVKELFKPDKITVPDENKAKKLLNMKEVLKHKALKNGALKSIHQAACSITGTSPLVSDLPTTKLPIGKSQYNKIPKLLTTKMNKQTAVSSIPVPPPAKISVTHSVPNKQVHDEFINGKLLASPDKQKLNIFKKISKVKDEKIEKSDQSDENIVKVPREEKLEKDIVSSTTASPPIYMKNDQKSPFAYMNYLPMEPNNMSKADTSHVVMKEESEIHMTDSPSSVTQSVSVDSGPGDFSYDHDWSPPNTPSTPKTPELVQSPPRNKKTEKDKEKKKRKEKIKEKKNKLQKLKSPKTIVPPACPRTPEGPINMTKERDISKDILPPHLHHYPFMPYGFPTGPGFIPRPGLIPGPLMPGPGLIPALLPNAMNPYSRIPFGLGKHGFGQPPHMPSHPISPFMMPRKMHEEDKVSDQLSTDKITPNCNVPPLVPPANIKELEQEPPDIVKEQAPTNEKQEKKKDKEHKKEKKDREGKIKKKKDKKEKLKLKLKDKERKRDKEEKRDKEKERIKKEKKIKRKEKERDVEGAVPKLTLKLGTSSPRPPTPEPQTTLSRKIIIKPVLKKDEESPPPVVSSTNREPSPELAKISALVTRPKPKSTKLSSHDDNQLTGSTSTTPVKSSPGPGRPRGSSNVVKNHPPNTERSHSKTLIVPPIKPAVDNDGNQVWICPACGRQDDGSPMIGCDDCDAWYHWVCVGIQVPPDDKEDWYCRVCIGKKQQIVGVANGERKKKRKKNKKSH